jgi:hypothetical protein
MQTKKTFMSKINSQILKEFNTYTDLRTKRKTILSSPISVTKVKGRHPSTITGKSSVTHATIQKDMYFEIEVKIDNSKNFKFKLFSEVFESPFFRYDSAGATHRNNDSEIPLKQQQITPPHFHQFNSKGIEIAYKTKALKSAKQLINLEDINVCVMHFCQEGNMRYKKVDFPEIDLQNGELGFTFTNEDPLQNINF